MLAKGVIMQIRRFANLDEFEAVALPFLARREAEHNLLLGLMSSLHAGEYDVEPYLACVLAAGEPALVALRTPPHNVILSHVETEADDAEHALALLAEDVKDQYAGAVPGVIASKPYSADFARVWQQVTGQAHTLNRAERIYQLDKVTPPQGIPGHMRRVRAADRGLCLQWTAAFLEEALDETDPEQAQKTCGRFMDSPPDVRGLYLWEVDGAPVSMTGYMRPTPNGICIGAVYTPPEYRRRGYAGALVAAVSQMMLDAGKRFCFLYTDLSNPTSNRIYQAIGYRPVCDVDEIRFVS